MHISTGGLALVLVVLLTAAVLAYLTYQHPALGEPLLVAMAAVTVVASVMFLVNRS
ncbi:hypothetical protein [Streptomyces iconiensis]|uniref:Uncharacterized protein n=1 Tax=Streptomyces iconiensis TaxID=1384038 RepID=A0ABT7A6A1_9ACTN|nr:hypothetical protein [Streptomyces iconiensis]MDJ1136867.1 hypothetical protein [Streptomyces iconiensis]